MRKIFIFIFIFLILANFTYAGEVVTNSSKLGNELDYWYEKIYWLTDIYVNFFNRTAKGTSDMGNTIGNPYVFDKISEQLQPEQLVIDKRNALAEIYGKPKLSDKEILQKYEMDILMSLAGTSWALVLGLFLMIRDAIYLLLVFFEMRLIIYVMIELLPSSLIKLSDNVINNIKKKRSI